MGSFRTAGGFNGGGRVCAGDCAGWLVRDRDGDTEAGRVLVEFCIVGVVETTFDDTPTIELDDLTGSLGGEDGFRGTAVTVTRVPVVLLDVEEVVEAGGLNICTFGALQIRRVFAGGTGIGAPYMPFCFLTASERVF